MGLSIYYDLISSGSRKKLFSCLRYIFDYAKSLGYEQVLGPWFVNYDTSVEYVDDDSVIEEYKDLYRLAKIQYDLHAPFSESEKSSGLDKVLKLHREGYVCCFVWRNTCVPLNFGFIRNGSKSRKWSGFGSIKTQWSKEFISTHISACRILDFCTEINIVENVYDESNYFDDGQLDVTKLIDCSEFNLGIINNVANVLAREVKKLKKVSVSGPGANVEDVLKNYSL